MSREQRESLEAVLRQVPLDAGGTLDVQRPLFEEFMLRQPLPDDIQLTDGTLGGVPVLEIEAPGADADARVLYFHGGVFALGLGASPRGPGCPRGSTSAGQGDRSRISARPRESVSGG
jgi:monoterpene epsilon-lactone hydrolase